MEERGLIERIKREYNRRVYKIRAEAVKDYFEHNDERRLKVKE